MREHFIACASVEAALYVLQDGRCFHCGTEMVVPTNFVERRSKRAITREHLIPRSRGGKNLDNVVLACRRCNERRGTTDLSPGLFKRGQKIAQRACLWATINVTDKRVVHVVECPFAQLDLMSEDIPDSVEGRLNHVLLQHMYDILEGSCFYCSGPLTARHRPNQYNRRFLTCAYVGNHQLSKINIPACLACQKDDSLERPDEDTVERADQLFRRAVERELAVVAPTGPDPTAWRIRLRRILTPWMMYQIGRGRASLRPAYPLSKKAIRARVARMVMPDFTQEYPVNGVPDVDKCKDPLAEVRTGPEESDTRPSWNSGMVTAAHQADGCVQADPR